MCFFKQTFTTLAACINDVRSLSTTLAPLVNPCLYFSLQVWSVSDGTQLEEYLLHSDHVNCVLYSPTQPHILSAADNGIVKVSMGL